MSSLPELLTIVVANGESDDHVLLLRGEVDVSNASLLFPCVFNRDPVAGESVMVDLAEVTFIDSCGLVALIRLSDYLSSRSCHLSLRAPSRPVRQVLELAGLTGAFHIVETAQTPIARLNEVDGREELEATG